MTKENWAIELKSPREIAAMHDAGRIVAQVFARLAEAVRPGISLRAALQRLSRQPAQPSTLPRRHLHFGEP
jgi:methionine aminopeptidase